ncbi:MAG TPA: hypothetical protein VIP05_34260, partial [Burkholderiaceae bacterium]
MRAHSTTPPARHRTPPARSPLATAVAAALAACALAPAHAALTDNLAVSPVAMSLGNAVTADPPGIDSIHANPAGLTH